MSSKTDQPYGVKVLVEGTDPLIDVIAVHGLDGHRERTWTAKNEASWLRDYLPTVVPNARILVYGYDGRTRSSEPLSCQKLHDHAISLVTDLTLHRTVTKTSKRPIIFIAHSIGGIIVKDALIHSNSANKSNLEHHNAIKISTYGILFFGTPHQGSDILTLTRSIMDTASRKKANHDIFKNLEKGSELLQKQIGQYNHISSYFVTKCFYEAYKSSSGRGTTVAPDSAIVPGATNVEVFPIYSNHENMVKYEAADNDDFRRVSSCLQLMAGDAPGKVSDNWQLWERVKAAESNGMKITFDIPFEPEYPKNQHFTGRQGLLDKVHQTIEEAQSTLVTIVLYGTGGVGKTQIASEYTHTHQKEYQSIFWINAATKESIELGYRTAAQRLVREHAKIAYGTNPNYSLIAKSLDMIGAVDENGFISPQEDHTECIIRGVKMWLAKEGNQNWLLVIDNADDLEDMALETYIPAATHGTIVITSRRTNWVSFTTVLEVEVMQEHEGKNLLLKSAGLQEDPIAEDVVTTLGYLPLAIVQAGAYVLVQQMSLKRYLEIYEECFNTIFGEPPSKANWHYGDRTVKTTWEISFKAIANKNQQAAELLSLCSFISNENIYDDMLRRGKKLRKDDTTLDTALGLLFSYSLAHRKGLSNSFYIHPLVHLWAHKRLGETECVQKTEEAVGMIANIIYRSGSRITKDVEGETRILPHILTTGKNIMRYLKAGSIDLKLSNMISQIGIVFLERGELEGAERLQLQVVQASQRILGKEHPDTLTSMNNLASTYWNQGRHKEAEVLELQVLEGRQSTLGKEHPDTLTSMSNLASTYGDQGRHKEAEVLGLQVLEGMQSTLGKEHPKTLTSMSNLASTYGNQGRRKEAEVLELQVLEGRQSTLGKEHPETLTSMSNLASTYWNQGRHKEAEVLELQVLEGMQSTLGKEHPETLTSMSNLASTYGNQGRHKEAEVLQLQALEGMQSTLGKEHPDTLTSMSNLASTYWHQGRHKEAEVLQLQALEGMQSTLGKEHPNTLVVMRNLQAMKCLRNNESPEKMASEICRMMEMTGDPKLAEFQMALEYERQGRFKEASELLQQLAGSLTGQETTPTETTEEMMFQSAVAMSLQQDTSGECSDGEGNAPDEFDPDAFTTIDELAAALGQNHPETLQATADLAATYWKQGRLKEVAVLELRLVDSIKSTLGEDHPGTLEAISNLVMTYIKQGRLSKAEELQLQVVEKMQRIQGIKHPDTLQANKLLGAVYWKQGRWKEAKKIIGRMKGTDDEMLQQAIKMSLSSEGAGGGSSEGGEGKLGKKSGETLRIMANQAATYWDLGKWKEAGDLELKVMRSRDLILGNEHPSTLLAKTNLAATYRDQERWEEAEVLEMEVMEARKKNLGIENPDTLIAITNLAGTYAHQGKWKEAEELNLQVVQARREILGKDHPSTLSAMASLATNHWHLEELEKAERIELKVVEARRRILGNEHPDTLTAAGNLAATYASQDRYEDAEKLQKEVLEVLGRTRGNNHFETLSALELVEVYYDGKIRKQSSEHVPEEAVLGFFKEIGDRMKASFLVSCLFFLSFFISFISFSCLLLSNLVMSFLFFFPLRIYDGQAIIQRFRVFIERVADLTGRFEDVEVR